MRANAMTKPKRNRQSKAYPGSPADPPCQRAHSRRVGGQHARQGHQAASDPLDGCAWHRLVRQVNREREPAAPTCGDVVCLRDNSSAGATRSPCLQTVDERRKATHDGRSAGGPQDRPALVVPCFFVLGFQGCQLGPRQARVVLFAATCSNVPHTRLPMASGS